MALLEIRPLFNCSCSSLTTSFFFFNSVANTVKRAFLIWISVFLFGNTVTFYSGLGTLSVIGGVLLYNKARQLDAKGIQHRLLISSRAEYISKSPNQYSIWAHPCWKLFISNRLDRFENLEAGNESIWWRTKMFVLCFPGLYHLKKFGQFIRLIIRFKWILYARLNSFLKNHSLYI